MGGSFVTTQQRLLEFQFPEFHHHKTIEWACHVDTKTDPKEAQYNMIVGMDLMNELGIDISFSTQKIVWAGATLPMHLQRILVWTESGRGALSSSALELPGGIHLSCISS